MLILVHLKKQRLEAFTASLVETNELYISKSFQLNDDLISLLNNIQSYYQQIGESTNESNISQLKIYFETALSGIDPIKFERVKTGKRSMINTAAFYCLSELNLILGSSLQSAIDILKSASDTISQIIFSAIQSKLIDDQELTLSDSVEKAEILWLKLNSNKQVALLEKRLKLEILPQDIYLIVDQVIEKIKVPNHAS